MNTNNNFIDCCCKDQCRCPWHQGKDVWHKCVICKGNFHAFCLGLLVEESVSKSCALCNGKFDPSVLNMTVPENLMDGRGEMVLFFQAMI